MSYVPVQNITGWGDYGGIVYIKSNNNIDIYDVRFVITRTHKARQLI